MGPTLPHDATHHTQWFIQTDRSSGGTWCYECGAFLEHPEPADDAARARPEAGRTQA